MLSYVSKDSPHMQEIESAAMIPDLGGALPMLGLSQDIKRDLLDVFRYRNVVISYVEMNLKLRYRRSFLGFIWTILSPLMSYLVIGFVFAMTTKTQIPNYFVYFFSGSVFFNFLTASITKAPSVMIENENYIKKIYLPKLTFILNGIFLEATNFILSLIALTILGLATGRLRLSASWLILPFPIMFTIFALCGLGCILSVAAVFFRDLIHVVPVIMQAVFFVTPIVYEPSSLGKYEKYVYWNPIYYFVEAFRTPIVDGHLPHAGQLLFVLIFSLVAFLVGYLILRKFDNKIVFKL